MSRLLHLSDLHLGRSADPLLGADPNGVLPSDPDQRFTFLAHSLERLGAQLDHPLDGVVISGDLVDRAAHDQFERIESLIAALGPAAPSRPEGIIVVPGNHDLAWDPPPPDRRRYEPWVDSLVARGYTSPFLDGWSDSDLRSPSGTLQTIYETDDMLLIPLNSSHFCWTLAELNHRRPMWDEVEEMVALPNVEGEQLTVLNDDPASRRVQFREALDALRRHDIARISTDQLTRVRRAMTQRARGRVVVAVLHHHLTPVGPHEELKTFESLTNLGEVKQALGELGVHVVLHGHKHQKSIFWDTLPHTPPGPAPWAGMRPVLVVAGPGEFKPEGVVARLLEIHGIGSAHWLEAKDVRAGRPIPKGNQSGVERFDLWKCEESVEPPPRTATISGPTVHTTYDRVMAHLEARPEIGTHDHFVCHVEDGRDARTMPPTYPAVPEDDTQAWFTRLVAWWQRPSGRSLSGDMFNHGERLLARWGNQLERAVNVLENADTTRAVLEVLDPSEETAWRDRRYPSLVLVQFGLRSLNSTRRLDVLGYWRKQELRYWWAINMAELRLLQERVADRLGDDVSPGTISTYAFRAHGGTSLPTAYLPEVDRAVDEAPGRLVELVYGVMHPEAVNRGQLFQAWEALLADLVVAHPSHPHDYPRLGIPELSSHLAAMCAARTSPTPAASLVLEQLDRVGSAHDASDIDRLSTECEALALVLRSAIFDAP